jgi:sulfate permease, SulP family
LAGAPRPTTRAWPVFGSMQGYRMAWLRPDVVAGLTVWAVLVPEALAYATIAGVPPVVGLYAAVPALVLYAAFGNSRTARRAYPARIAFHKAGRVEPIAVALAERASSGSGNAPASGRAQ